jgi:uncharacterized protein YndB with AHSA1/START domain
VLYELWLAAELATSAVPSAWLDEGDVQRRLADGQVVVRSAVDERDSHARVAAAVTIHAPPQLVWQVLVDCEEAASFIPGLKHCHRIDGAPDDSWEIIEHDFKYSWLTPTIHSVFRIENQPPQRIEFRRLSGDLKDEQGAWQLLSTAGGTSTTVEYQVEIDPGFWIPKAIVRHALRKELPAALQALRTRAEKLSSQGQPGAAPPPAPPP